MPFNSFPFALFLATVFLLYWFALNRNLKVQNLFLVAASYIFYACWDWRFLGLIVFISFFTFYLGLWINKVESKNRRKLLLYLGLLINLGLLGFFKYYNFFIEPFRVLIMEAGIPFQLKTMNIILPLGISFYIFHTLGYLFDVYRKKCDPSTDLVAFFAYISFFPKLITGPIEKATTFLPQFYKKREFDIAQASDGLRQILWGLFKKMVVADNLGIKVDDIFANYTHLPASTLWLGVFYYAFQIYCDFSGYSDIAIGTGRLFGFSLSQNFLFPYFSRDIAEFWRRWHITLFKWFREYVYLPIVWFFSQRMPKTHYLGIKTENYLYLFGIMITFFLTGLWHGANWTFIAWGLINGLLFIPLLFRNRKRKRTPVAGYGKLLPGFKEALLMGLNFLAIMLAWVFFRSDNVTNAFDYLGNMFDRSFFITPLNCAIKTTIPFILILVIVEWLQRNREHGLDISFIKHRSVRWSIYYSVILIIILFGGEQQSFIYFQF